MKRPAFAAIALAAALAACGDRTPAENNADALEEAAEYSTPEAANALESAADQVRESNSSDPAAVDRAMDQAGNAQAPPPPMPPLPPAPGNGQ